LKFFDAAQLLPDHGGYDADALSVPAPGVVFA
jgi:hypothetical protein